MPNQPCSSLSPSQHGRQLKFFLQVLTATMRRKSHVTDYNLCFLERQNKRRGETPKSCCLGGSGVTYIHLSMPGWWRHSLGWGRGRAGGVTGTDGQMENSRLAVVEAGCAFFAPHFPRYQMWILTLCLPMTDARKRQRAAGSPSHSEMGPYFYHTTGSTDF